jgi:thymidylate synthase (FAD)
MDLHNLFKFLKLRCDRNHAQREIADLANGIFELIKPIVPVACAAFEKYWINSIVLTREEFLIITSGIDSALIKKNITDSKLTARQKKDLFTKLNYV